MFLNPILSADHSEYALIWAILVGVALVAAFLKPRRLFVVMTLTLVALFLPPFHSKYLTLALAIGPVSLHIFDYLFIGVVLILLKLFFQSPGRLSSFVSGNYLVLTAMFLGWHIIRAVIDIAAVGKEPEMVLRLFVGRCYILLVIAIPLILSTSKDFSWQKTRKFLLIIVGILPAIAFYNIISVPEGLVGTSSGTRRFLFGTANLFLAFGFVVVLAGMRARWFPKGPAIIYLIWMLIGMLLTQHRSFVVAVIAVLAIDTLFCSKSSEKSIRFIAGFLLMIIAIALAPVLMKSSDSIVSEALTRVVDTFDSSNTTSKGRIDKWGQRLEIFKKSPWTGLGYGRESSSDVGRSEFRKSAGHEAHNFIITILTYEGLLGLIVNLLLIYFAFWHCWALMRRSKRRGLEIPLLYLTYFIIYSLFNTTYFNTITAPCFFAALGVVAHLHRKYLKKPRKVAVERPWLDVKTI